MAEEIGGSDRVLAPGPEGGSVVCRGSQIRNLENEKNYLCLLDCDPTKKKLRLLILTLRVRCIFYQLD